MKTKIVLWGANEADEKLLLGIELVDKENKVLIHKIPEAAATEEVYKMMMDSWRDGKEMTWPPETEEIIRELSMADGLLPDDIKVERTDVIARAKAEWHFVVLSSKLYEMYRGEVEDFKDKVNELTDFDSKLWEELKTFWTKVQNQVQDKNLFREHASKLRSKTNEIFDSMKALKKTADTEYKKKSKEVAKEFKEKLAVLDEKIGKGLGLKPIFEELKKLQSQVRDAAFTRDDRNDIWKKIDRSFKAVKEKRFGDKATSGNSGVGRLESRYNGLLSAINRMQGSIKKDTQDKEFQTRRINNTDGQLEAQIRQAKLMMIDERINSKQVKLDDMLKTKVELEHRMEKEKAKEAARAAKAKSKEVAKEIKAKIQDEIANKNSSRTPEEEAELKKAAEAIAATKKKRAAKGKSDSTEKSKKSTSEKVEDLLSAKAPNKETKKEANDTPQKEESLLGAIGDAVGEAIDNVSDTVKAVTAVVSNTVDDKIEDVKSSLTDNDSGKSDSIVDSVKNTVSDTIQKVKDAAESAKETIESKIDSEDIEDKAKSLKDKISSAIDDTVEKAKEVGDTLAGEVEGKINDVKATVTEKAEKIADKPSAKEGGIMGALTGLIDEAVDVAKDIGDIVADKLEDLTGEEE